MHHSAEVLSPLTLHRSHPIESLLFRLRRVVVTAVVAGTFLWAFRPGTLAAPMVALTAVGLALNALIGNLRHSHIHLRFGRLEALLVSPAQHQLHHSADPADHDCNFGVWFACWDRLFGTWKPSGTHAPAAFGVGAARNHGEGLLSAWWHPVVSAMGTLLPRPVKRRAVAAVAAVLPISAAAQEDVYEIVVTDEAGVPAVAGSATVLDEEDLERFEHDDIHAILAEAPGVYTRTEDGFGLRPNIGIRGAASERSSKVMLLEDGVPVAPAPYAAPAAYYFPMSTRMVGVEVFKGPAAIQYGPQTVGGAINMRTRAVPTAPAGGLDLAVGMRNSVKLHAWTGTGNDVGGALVEGVHLASGGFKQLPDDGPTGFDRSELMIKLRRSLGSMNTVQLKLGLAREDSHETYTGLLRSDVEATPYARYAATALDRMQWLRTQAELSVTARPSRHVDVHATAYHHYLHRSWFKLNRFADGPALFDLLTGSGQGRDAVYLAILRGEADSATDADNLMVGTNERTFHSMGVQARMRTTHALGEGRIRTEVGMRVHHDIVDRLHTEDAHAMRDGELVRTDDERLVNTDSRAVATGISTHALVDVSQGRWHLTPSTRVEHVITHMNDEPQQHRTVVLPGMGVRFEATPALDLFAGTHRGFSPVSPGQDKAVRPESSVNSELGLRLGSGTRLGELTGFVSHYRNLVGECTFSVGCADQDVGTQFNGGQVLITGVEASYRDDVPLTPGLTLPVQANYTLTHGTFLSSFTSSFPQYGSVDAGNHLPYVPVHQAHGRIGVAATRWGIDTGITLRSGMRDTATDGPNDDIPGLILVDAAGHVDVDEHIQLYTTVSNALNNAAVVSLRPYGARTSAPVQVMVGVKVR